MTQTTFRVYLAITWIVTVGLAYMVGWWRGVSRAVGVATSTAQTSFSFVFYALIVVAIVAAVAAYRARGYFSHRSNSPTT